MEEGMAIQTLNAWAGRLIGFSIMGVTKFKKDKPLETDLVAV
jgi:hypothetical protein